MSSNIQNSDENTETMGKIMLKLTALSVGCILAAWGIVRLMEMF